MTDPIRMNFDIALAEAESDAPVEREFVLKDRTWHMVPVGYIPAGHLINWLTAVYIADDVKGVANIVKEALIPEERADWETLITEPIHGRQDDGTWGPKPVSYRQLAKIADMLYRTEVGLPLDLPG